MLLDGNRAPADGHSKSFNVHAGLGNRRFARNSCFAPPQIVLSPQSRSFSRRGVVPKYASEVPLEGFLSMWASTGRCSFTVSVIQCPVRTRTPPHRLHTRRSHTIAMLETQGKCVCGLSASTSVVPVVASDARNLDSGTARVCPAGRDALVSFAGDVRGFRKSCPVGPQVLGTGVDEGWKASVC